MKVDFLIVGQGLAGSLLAFELIQRGCKVLVLDSGKSNASQCAAGLINPVTGMRFVKTAHVEQLLPAAKQSYQYLSDFFQQKFYIEKTMLKIFRSAEESRHAQKRLTDENYQPYLGEILDSGGFNSPFGMIAQKQTGYLLTQPLLSALKDFFIAQNSYRQVKLDYGTIKLAPELSWSDVVTEKMVFCEGYQLRLNPWFKQLPLQPAKGEILTLQLSHAFPALAENILNYGHWLIPLTQTTFRTGATFVANELNTDCTTVAKQLLLNSLQQILPVFVDAKVQAQQANIRPCTLDKQPFIGLHPNFPQLAVFNGFGAKGSLQIPYYAKQFADYCLTGRPLAATVDIHRYASLFQSDAACLNSSRI
jgi:glycine/D-amino acid oxidase-like deaminating enzyme